MSIRTNLPQFAKIAGRCAAGTAFAACIAFALAPDTADAGQRGDRQGKSGQWQSSGSGQHGKHSRNDWNGGHHRGGPGKSPGGHHGGPKDHSRVGDPPSIDPPSKVGDPPYIDPPTPHDPGDNDNDGWEAKGPGVHAGGCAGLNIPIIGKLLRHNCRDEVYATGPALSYADRDYGYDEPVYYTKPVRRARKQYVMPHRKPRYSAPAVRAPYRMETRTHYAPYEDWVDGGSVVDLEPVEIEPKYRAERRHHRPAARHHKRQKRVFGHGGRSAKSYHGARSGRAHVVGVKRKVYRCVGYAGRPESVSCYKKSSEFIPNGGRRSYGGHKRRHRGYGRY